VTQTFPRSRKSRPGYRVSEVEQFLARARLAYDAEPGGTGTIITAEEIRRTGFAIEKGGYNMMAVDAALERLEEAFSARERDRIAGSMGDDAWFSAARERAREILARLERPDRKKFSGSGVFTLGYEKRDVDDFARRLVAYFREGATVPITEVRGVVFRSRTRGYSEAQVDAVLDAVVDVMLAVR
jgi:DivIVA domain-containing protein